MTPYDALSIVLILSLLVNWSLYAQLVQVCITLFNTMSLLVQSLLEVKGQQDPLPAFDYTQFEDSEYVSFFLLQDMNETFSGWLLMILLSGFHIGSPKTMLEWS